MNTPGRSSKSNPTFSHVAPNGTARMVDVHEKPSQHRQAKASGQLTCQATTIRALRKHALPKGDVLTVAQVAGIQAAKRAADWIPLCHPLPIDHIDLTFQLRPTAIVITCRVTTVARTGVEMEALTGVSAAALTLYDMCKAVDRQMRIENIHVVEKIKQ